MLIIVAWQCISPEVILNSIMKCCISNAVDGSEDDTLWNGSDEDGNVSIECEKDECATCEDGDSDTNW
jgi:hypothetical protein